MTIAVPTDFSACSSVALQYAITFARQIKAELLLFHVLPDIGPTLGRLSTDTLKKEMLDSVNIEFEKLKQAAGVEDVTINCQIAFGSSITDVLELLIEAQTVDFVIVGSKGAAGYKRVLLGSNAVDVINSCPVPVIVVPGLATISPVSYLVYASDLKNIDEETKLILPYAKLLNTTLRIIHIPPLQYLEQINTGKLVNLLKEENDYQNIELIMIKGDDVIKEIENYVYRNSSQLLVMFTHHLSFLEQLFSKSLTREIVWHNKIPLLVINNR